MELDAQSLLGLLPEMPSPPMALLMQVHVQYLGPEGDRHHLVYVGPKLPRRLQRSFSESEQGKEEELESHSGFKGRKDKDRNCSTWPERGLNLATPLTAAPLSSLKVTDLAPTIDHMFPFPPVVLVHQVLSLNPPA